MALTNKQQLFVDEYLQHYNATRAAIAAGYSPKTARKIGSENLTKPDIKAEIDRALSESAMSRNEVIMRLAEQARGAVIVNVAEGEQPTLDLTQLAENDQLHLVKKFTQTETLSKQQGSDDEWLINRRVSVELYDSQSALKMLGTYHRLFVERHEHSGPDGNPIETEDKTKPDLSRYSVEQLKQLRGILYEPAEPA